MTVVIPNDDLPEEAFAPARPDYGVTAAYDPSDNKIRLRCRGRLDAALGPELYARVKAAGFAWAPKQDLFVAPMWTPAREDLAIELAGELGDEDTSLVDRAEERSDRFEGYSARRKDDAEGARAAVEQVSKRFEFGQPLLIGHHSERSARRDKERIENGMRKAVKLWETSSYWTARAAGARDHARYKELPAVRARRIKTLEADQRSHQRDQDAAIAQLDQWGSPVLTLKRAIALANDGRLGVHRCFTLAEFPRQPPASQYEGSTSIWSALDGGIIDEHQAASIVLESAHARIGAAGRWLAHLTNRLLYERAMLEESGYTPPPKPKTKAALPLLNYSGEVAYRNAYNGKVSREQAVGVTKAQLARIGSDYKGTRVSEDGTHRIRTAMYVKPGDSSAVVVYLTDSKQHARPGAAEAAKVAAEREAAEHAEMAALDAAAPAAIAKMEAAREKREQREAEAQPFTDIKAALRAGVEVVVAPDLYPTPAPVAARMVAALGVQPGDKVLEPSAGTGELVRAVIEAQPSVDLTLVESDGRLCKALQARAWLATARILRADFALLAVTLGTFDRIIMNPPFGGGRDVKHIQAAIKLLAPGGRLVALCADGPRQREHLGRQAREMGGTYESLGDVGFEGTRVNVAMVTVERAR